MHRPELGSWRFAFCSRMQRSGGGTGRLEGCGKGGAAERPLHAQKVVAAIGGQNPHLAIGHNT
jgi:hypothetical protein